MRRLEAIRQVAAEWTDELVVATTGMISRELYVVRDRPENFYMCGSMGWASQFPEASMPPVNFCK